MPRHYQHKKNNPYLLPHKVRMGVLYILRHYPEMKEEYNNRVEYSVPMLSSSVKSSKLCKPTEEKGIMMAESYSAMHVIEAALERIPEQERKAVYRKIIQKKQTDRSTETREYENKLLYEVAKGIGLISGH